MYDIYRIQASFVLFFFFLHLISYSSNSTIFMHTPTLTHRKKKMNGANQMSKKAILYLKRNPEEENTIQADCFEEKQRNTFHSSG